MPTRTLPNAAWRLGFARSTVSPRQRADRPASGCATRPSACFTGVQGDRAAPPRAPAARSRRPSSLSKPARQPADPARDLFDLAPDDEQQMLRESVRDFALAESAPGRRRRPTRLRRPAELLAQANELGLTMVGVPEELGGAVHERSAVDHRADVPRRWPTETWGSRSPAWRRPRSPPRSACGATPTSRPPTCPRSSARTFRPRRWRCWSRGRCSIRSR